MHDLPPVLQRISDGIELTNPDCDLSAGRLIVGDDFVDILNASLPFGSDDRALFFVKDEPDGAMHVALANGWGRCALGVGLPDPDVRTLPSAVACWRPDYLEQGWWRMVRFPSSLLVALIDVPADPDMPLTDLLRDLSFLSNYQHLITHRKEISGFSWTTDPFAPLLENFYKYGQGSELLSIAAEEVEL